MHIRKSPFFLVTIAIWLTQSVGSVMEVSTPAFTRLSISVLTRSRMAIGMLRHGNTRGLIVLSTLRVTQPRSPKMLLEIVLTKRLSLTVTKFILLTVSRPSKH